MTPTTTLKRLLGSAEAEILCDDCFEKVDQYVDLELRGADADSAIPGMRPHLGGCAACLQEYESLRVLANGHMAP